MSDQERPEPTEDRYAKYDDFEGPGAELADAYRRHHARRSALFQNANNGIMHGGDVAVGSPRKAKFGDHINRYR